MEDHTTTDSTLSIVRELRRDYPWLGAVLQAYLYRTEDDCRELADEGSRIRLCKGAYAEPASVAHPDANEIDKAYVRCLKILMAGSGYPMVATHDPRLVEIAVALAEREQRAKDTFELQMLYGIRPSEQARLAELGHTVRVYVPYGTDWYGYLVRRLAEKPANVRFFAHSLVSRTCCATKEWLARLVRHGAHVVPVTANRRGVPPAHSPRRQPHRAACERPRAASPASSAGRSARRPRP